MIRTTLFASALTMAATAGMTAPEKYTMDPSHSQLVVSYEHAGFSQTYWILSGFEGEVMYDAQDPAASSVSTSIGADQLFTGWDARQDHIMKSGEFFDLAAFPDLTFTSTSIEVTGDATALIRGDLSLNGVTKEVVLDATLNTATDAYPFPPFAGKPAIGVSATAEILRSDFNLGLYAPFIGDALDLRLSIEAMKLE